MSLTDRLRKIEARLTTLEDRADQGEQTQAALVDAVEQVAAADDEGKAEPTRTLDGEEAGGERDQSQEL